MLVAQRSDDRRWDRVPVEIPVELFHTPERDGRAALALDLSWNGARIQGRSLPLKHGERVDVVLQGGEGWDRRAARVIWVEHSGPEQRMEAGLEFLQPVIDPD
ncbi:MAG TPA: PilZ domain-containing protein [Terriglobia bacterium]|nr:PilZ domain-containing protein [Terriglobia bacterium]